jgi:Cu/Zn superoxide dismutase
MTFSTRSQRGFRRPSRFLPVLLLAASAGMTAAVPGVAWADTARPYVQSIGSLVDLQPSTPNPTDGAQAQFYAFTVGDQTTAILVVRGLSDSVGQTFGAHVHVGPCVAGMGTLAGPHYRSPATAPASPTTEVWLDFTVLPGGIAVSRTTVPFSIPAGAAQAVVIHAAPTASDGSAGARMACLPVAF